MSFVEFSQALCHSSWNKSNQQKVKPMKIMLNTALTHVTKIYEIAVDQAKNAVDFVVNGFKLILDWHKRQLVDNPMYPVTVLSIGKSVIRIAVPSATIAAAVIALLAAVLGDLPYNQRWDWDDDQY